MTTKLSSWTRAGRTLGALCVGVLLATPTDVLGQGTFSGNVSGSAGDFTGVDADLLDGLNSSVFAQTGANTFTATQTIDTGNLDLDASTATTGNRLKDGTRFLHNFGTDNTFLGAQAGNFTLTGEANTASGVNALAANTAGGDNVATGAAALNANTAGFRNVAAGSRALLSNTTGSNNVATGYEALNSNTTGFSNVASGFNALSANTTGFNNVAIGIVAGQLATGSANIFLGADVSGVAGESNTMYLGKRTGFTAQTTTFIAGVRGQTTGVADAVAVLIDSNGELGTIDSSRRYKEDIEDMAGTSSSLLSLRPVTFRYKKAFTDGSKPIQYGLIAEEVAEVFPDLVVYNEDGEPETVKYHVLATMLVNELQKLQRVTADQAAQLVSLERQNRTHERERERLAAVEATLVLAPLTVGDVNVSPCQKDAYATASVTGAILDCNLLHRKVLTSHYQQRMAQAPIVELTAGRLPWNNTADELG